jgi:hypothetical protein
VEQLNNRITILGWPLSLELGLRWLITAKTAFCAGSETVADQSLYRYQLYRPVNSSTQSFLSATRGTWIAVPSRPADELDA